MDRNKLVYGVLIVVICWLGFLSWKSFNSQKIAYVDTNVLVQRYEGMKDARLEFSKKSKTWQAKSDTLVKQWEAELKTYEKERKQLSEKERKLKEEILRNKQAQINNFQRATEGKAREEEQKLSQTIINEVNDYIGEYGKKHGYEYILGANGSGNILYAKKANDITEIILEGLNKDYSKRK